MTDTTMTQAVILAADLKSLELLYDYTKFHIGFYLSISSAFITIASVKRGDSFLLNLGRPFVWFALACFMLAGFSGGVIVSSITQCLGYPMSALSMRCSSTEGFFLQQLGPLEFKWFLGRTWTQIEHGAFWLGLVSAIFSFLTGKAPLPTNKPLTEVKIHGPIEVRNMA